MRICYSTTTLLLFMWFLPDSEILQCRMQVQGTDSVVMGSGRYSSPLDCAIKTIKSDGVRKYLNRTNELFDDVPACWHDMMYLQLTGIFRGGYATLLRESIGNAVFFSTYEYIRYNIRSQLKYVSSSPNQLIDSGIGIMSGGLGGIAVCFYIHLIESSKILFP